MVDQEQQPSGAFDSVIQPANDPLPVIPSANFSFADQDAFERWASTATPPELQALFNRNDANVDPHLLNMYWMAALKRERDRGAAAGETVATALSPGQLQERGLLQNPDGVIPQVPNAGPAATSLPGSAELPDLSLHRPDEPKAHKN